MIIDQTINEIDAKYFCVINKKLVDEVLKQANKAVKSENDLKTGIQTSIALGPNAKDKIANIQSESKNFKTKKEKGKFIQEGFVDWFLNLRPAWVEEPTGFNLAAPEEVFKNNVEGGIRSYNTGILTGAATGVGSLGIANPAIRNSALKVAKNVSKFSVNHPIVATGAAIAINNPKGTIDAVKAVADIGKNGVDELGKFEKFLEKLQPYIDTVCRWFSPVIGFFKKSPLTASAIGAICYGLFLTRQIWFPYIRRLGYTITKGKTLARVDFEANETNYTFQYTLNKHKWALLSGGKIASPEETSSFIQTKFAKRFLNQCKENFDCLFNHKNVFLAQASLVGGQDLVDQFKDFLKDEAKFKANFYNTKLLV